MNYGVHIKLADGIFLGGIPSTWEDKIGTHSDPKNVTEVLQNQQYKILRNTYWEGRKPTENVKWLNRKIPVSNDELKHLSMFNIISSKKSTVIVECARWHAIS